MLLRFSIATILLGSGLQGFAQQGPTDFERNQTVALKDVVGKNTVAAKAEKDSSAEPIADDSEPAESGSPDSPDTSGIAASLMGEFVGQIRDADDQSGASSTMAMQIRPMADGRFEAVSYGGGLPGQDGFEADHVNQYIGLINGQTLVLSGGRHAIFVDAQGCTIIQSDGERLGRLDRVERTSPTLGAAPPESAISVFNGSDTDELDNADVNEDATLRHGATIRPIAQDFDLHVEFKLPRMFDQLGQKRGNSGIYLQGRYECQVLDSFATLPVFNGAGALYRFKPPSINMVLPPGVWQTYDIRFTAARFNSDGSKRLDARVTSWLNGVKVQDDVVMNGPTGHGAEETPTLLPTILQDHGDQVVFRNIWMIDRGLTPGVDFPVLKR